MDSLRNWRAWLAAGVTVGLAVAVGMVRCPGVPPVQPGTSTTTPTHLVPPRQGTWWAVYAGMKYHMDPDDVHAGVVLRDEGFFRKYPEGQRAVWERRGIDWDAFAHWVFSIESVGVRLNRLLGGAAFAWPDVPDAAFVEWWDRDVLGPVTEVFGDYLFPRSLDNADLDADIRVGLGRRAGSPLSNEDRRVGVICLASRLNHVYHDEAKRDGYAIRKREDKLWAAWRSRGALKPGAVIPGREDGP